MTWGWTVLEELLELAWIGWIGKEFGTGMSPPDRVKFSARILSPSHGCSTLAVPLAYSCPVLGEASGRGLP